MPTSKKSDKNTAKTTSPLQSNVTVINVVKQPKTSKPSILGEGNLAHGFVNTFGYMARVLDEPSPQHGIQGGNIRNLEIKDANGLRVAFYNKGWDGDEPTDPAVKKAVEELVSYFATYSFENPTS